MYTVIIYYDDSKCQVERYKFIFFSLQEDNQLYLCPCRSGDKVEDIVNLINELTQSRQEWKLILFVGMDCGIGKNIGASLPETMWSLIQFYTGKEFKDMPRVRGYFPEHLYCVICGEKPRVYGPATGLFTVDECFSEGDRPAPVDGRFRMFWFGMDRSCEKNEYFDWLRLDCLLLILAINQIPSGVLEYGYLYQLDIDIDREIFSQYVWERQQQLEKVGQYLEIVGSNLQKGGKAGEGYPENTGFTDSLDECRKKIRKPRPLRKLRRKDLRDADKLKQKLEENRREVHAQIYFPRGLLREEAARIQDKVEKRPEVGEMLSTAGRDLLEYRMWENLEKICKLKRVPLNQEEYERKYEEREEAILQCAQKKMKRSVKVLACLLLSVVEWGIIMPFLQYSVQKGREGFENLLYRLLIKDRLNRFPWEGIKGLWTYGVVWLVCLAAVFIIVFLCSFVKEICVIGCYSCITWKIGCRQEKKNSYLGRKMGTRQERKIRYYEKAVNLLAEYQYCIRLLKEQEERERDWEVKMNRLQGHRNAWKQNRAVCRQLKFFAYPEDEHEDMSADHFDIGEDPGQVEYYWIPFKESSAEAELNGSGYYVRGMFRFITQIHISKTVERGSK